MRAPQRSRRASGSLLSAWATGANHSHCHALAACRRTFGPMASATSTASAASSSADVAIIYRKDRFGSIRRFWLRVRSSRRAHAAGAFISISVVDDATPKRLPIDNDTAAAPLPNSAVSSSSSPSSPSPPTLCRPLRIAATCGDWQPSRVSLALNATIGSREAGIVVLDGLVSEQQRAALLSEVLLPGGDCVETPQPDVWSRTCVDSIGMPPTWGMRPALLRRLEEHPPECVMEIHARLSLLYPEYEIAHMPTFAEEGAAATAADEEGSGGGSGASRTSFVANAAECGDGFSWHYDADTRRLPSSAWRDAYGEYRNGTAGKPLLVSLLVYCNACWQEDWQAETLFVHDSRGVGFLVQPRPARCVLMHQDVLHRVSAPSRLAQRARFSLVWKLAFLPRRTATRGQQQPHAAGETICRAEWGKPLQL